MGTQCLSFANAVVPMRRADWRRCEHHTRHTRGEARGCFCRPPRQVRRPRAGVGPGVWHGSLHPLGSLLGDYLEFLERILPDSAPDELERLSDANGAMVAACLAPEQDRADSAGPQIDFVLRERIRQAIRRYLRLPQLGPRFLCRRLSISRSKLYRLMDAKGGVAHYIQRQRLLEAHALLSDLRVERSITAIADELCFADASRFSRAFRREFIASPSEVRAASRTGQKLHESSTHANSAAARSPYSILRTI